MQLLYAFSDKELRKMWRSKVDQDLWHTLYVTAGELELFSATMKMISSAMIDN